MKFDKVFEVIRKEEVSDGMGGFDITEVMIGNITCFTSPVTAEIMLKEHGVVSNSSLKIFTKDTIPNEHIQLRYSDRKNNTMTDYEILQVSDYEKYRMLLVQVI